MPKMASAGSLCDGPDFIPHLNQQADRTIPVSELILIIIPKGDLWTLATFGRRRGSEKTRRKGEKACQKEARHSKSRTACHKQRKMRLQLHWKRNGGHFR